MQPQIKKNLLLNGFMAMGMLIRTQQAYESKPI
jgi:hypothetical protein